MDYCRVCHENDEYAALAECDKCGAGFHRACAADGLEDHLLTCRAEALLRDAAKSSVFVGNGLKDCLETNNVDAMIECMRKIPLNELTNALIEMRVKGKFDALKTPLNRVDKKLLTGPGTNLLIADVGEFMIPDVYLYLGPGVFVPAMLFYAERGVTAEWRPNQRRLDGIISNQSNPKNVMREIMRVVDEGPIIRGYRGNEKRTGAAPTGPPLTPDSLADAPPAMQARYQPTDTEISLPYRVEKDPATQIEVGVVGDQFPRDESPVLPNDAHSDQIYLYAKKDEVTYDDMLGRLKNLDENLAKDSKTKKNPFRNYSAVGTGLAVFWTSATLTNQYPELSKSVKTRRRRRTDATPVASLCYLVIGRNIYVIAARFGQKLTSGTRLSAQSSVEAENVRAMENQRLTRGNVLSYRDYITQCGVVNALAASRTKYQTQFALTHYLMYLQNVDRMITHGVPKAASVYFKAVFVDAGPEWWKALNVVEWYPPGRYRIDLTHFKLTRDMNSFRLPIRFIESNYFESLSTMTVETDFPIRRISLNSPNLTKLVFKSAPDSGIFRVPGLKIRTTGYLTALISVELENVVIPENYLQDLANIALMSPGTLEVHLTNVLVKRTHLTNVLLKRTRLTLSDVVETMRNSKPAPRLSSLEVISGSSPTSEQVDAALGLIKEDGQLTIDQPNFVLNDEQQKRVRFEARSAAPLYIAEKKMRSKKNPASDIAEFDLAAAPKTRLYTLHIKKVDAGFEQTLFSGTFVVTEVTDTVFARSMFVGRAAVKQGPNQLAMPDPKLMESLADSVKRGRSELATLEATDVMRMDPSTQDFDSADVDDGELVFSLTVNTDGVDKDVITSKSIGVADIGSIVAEGVHEFNVFTSKFSLRLTAPLQLENDLQEDDYSIRLITVTDANKKSFITGIHVTMAKRKRQSAFSRAILQYGVANPRGKLFTPDADNLPKWITVHDSDVNAQQMVAMHGLWLKASNDLVNVEISPELGKGTALRDILDDEKIHLTAEEQYDRSGDRLVVAKLEHVLNPTRRWRSVVAAYNSLSVAEEALFFSTLERDQTFIPVLSRTAIPIRGIRLDTQDVALYFEDDESTVRDWRVGQYRQHLDKDRDLVTEFHDYYVTVPLAENIQVVLPSCYVRQEVSDGNVTCIEVVASDRQLAAVVGVRLCQYMQKESGRAYDFTTSMITKIDRFSSESASYEGNQQRAAAEEEFRKNPAELRNMALFYFLATCIQEAIVSGAMSPQSPAYELCQSTLERMVPTLIWITRNVPEPDLEPMDVDNGDSSSNKRPSDSSDSSDVTGASTGYDEDEDDMFN